jgi:RNA polymerase primary sigma factor
LKDSNHEGTGYDATDFLPAGAPLHAHGEENDADANGNSDVKERWLSSPLSVYLNEVLEIGTLSREREIELAKRMKDGDESAREELVQAHLGLVVAIARQYSCPEIQTEDLIQEGNIALLAAARYYDYRKGRFIHSAVQYIRLGIYSFLKRQEWIPNELIAMLSRYLHTEEEFEKKHGQKPSRKEIAEEMGVPEKRIAHIEVDYLCRRLLSLESEIEQADKSGQELYIPDEKTPDPAEILQTSEMFEQGDPFASYLFHSWLEPDD